MPRKKENEYPFTLSKEEETTSIAEAKNFVKEYGQYLVHGTFALGIASLAGGAYVALRRPKRAATASAEVVKVVEKANPEDEAAAVRMAFRALLYGTALSTVGFSATVIGACWYLDIHSVSEFGTRMREIVPQGKDGLVSLMSPILEAVNTAGQWLGLKTRQISGVHTPEEGEAEQELMDEYSSLPERDQKRLKKIGDAIVKMDEQGKPARFYLARR